MMDPCNACGSTSESLQYCERCKTVAYCSAECQRRDWKSHRAQCKRKEYEGSPCGICHCTEKENSDICLECGFLFCSDCDEQNLTRNEDGEIVSFEPCPDCQTRRGFRNARSRKKLEKLVDGNPNDPRLAQWLISLGAAYLDAQTLKMEKKAKATFLRAGDMGFGEGYSRVAEMYIEKREWEEARCYYEKAAELCHVVAIDNLASEASQGYFQFGNIVQQDKRRPPDLEAGYRWYKEGARLGYPLSCGGLSHCYLEGMGTEQNLKKAFKWAKLGAEKGPGQKGSAECMRQCGIMYAQGKGVKQSDEQAIYWLQKALEIEDDDEARSTLRKLQEN